MKPFRIEISGYGPMEMMSEKANIMARSEKDALVCFLEKLGDDHPLWQAAGWQVQVFERSTAFQFATL
jgi:hypothetical protein